MGLPIIIIFACVWYLPLYLKHRKNAQESYQYYLEAFVLGVVCTVFALVAQLGIGLILSKIPMSTTVQKITGFLRVLIGIAVTEEVSKFLLGRIVLKKVPNLTEAGSMLILGMTGIGFDFAESLTELDILSSVVRGVLMLHLFLQLFMGKYWWRAQEAKKAGHEAAYKKNISISLIVPIVVHAIYDYLLLKGGSMEDNLDLGVLLWLSGALFGFVYMIYCLVMARKTIKAETVAVIQPEKM